MMIETKCNRTQDIEEVSINLYQPKKQSIDGRHIGMIPWTT